LLGACLFERVYLATGVFGLYSFMLWGNPSQYKTTEEKWEKILGIYWKSSLCEYAHYEISLLLTFKMKHIPSSWPAIQTRTRSPKIMSEQNWTGTYEKDYERQRPRPVIHPYALHWLQHNLFPIRIYCALGQYFFSRFVCSPQL
jgi:hypothetical protein